MDRDAPSPTLRGYAFILTLSQREKGRRTAGAVVKKVLPMARGTAPLRAA